MINTRQFIANQQIKTAFATNGILLTMIQSKSNQIFKLLKVYELTGKLKEKTSNIK